MISRAFSMGALVVSSGGGRRRVTRPFMVPCMLCDNLGESECKE